MASDPTPAVPDDHIEVERSITIPADADTVREALMDPDALSVWLGPWRADRHGAQVTTDDGTVRAVRDHRVDDHGDVRWRWNPCDRPDEVSDVRISVEPHGGDASQVRVIERMPQPDSSSGTWSTTVSASAATAQPGPMGLVRLVIGTGALLALAASMFEPSCVRT